MIVVDTGFISSFLKIERVICIQEFFGFDEIVITQQVYDELKMCDVFNELINVIQDSKIKIRIKNLEEEDETEFKELLQKYPAIGKGELSITAIGKTKNAIVLIEDRKAEKIAEYEGVTQNYYPKKILKRL